MSKKVIIFLSFLLFFLILIFVLLGLRKNKTINSNFFFNQTEKEEFYRKNSISPTQYETNNQNKSSETNSRDVSALLNTKLPIETADFKLEFSSTLNRYILTKKTTNASMAIDEWLKKNNSENLLNSNLLIINDLTVISPASKNLPTTSLIPSTTISATPEDSGKNLSLLIDLLKALMSFNTIRFPTVVITMPSPSNQPINPTAAPPLNTGGSYDGLGLPVPVSDGINGYLTLKSKIESNPNSLWAVQQLLAAEKTYRDKGGSIIPYLTTAWIWFENGASSWPDPYEVNCNDDRPNYSSEVSFYCNSSNFQIAGYQAAERKSNYIGIFNIFYSNAELKTVLQAVVDNSHHASKTKWNYKDSGQNKGLISRYLSSKSIPASITLNDISPSRSFFSEEGQFFTLILGKDPKMAVALNSFAVNSSFLNQLKNANDSHKLYGYIGNREVQLISNMIAALYMIDTGSLPSSGFTGGGDIVSWAGQISNNLQAGQVCDGWNCRQINNSISNGSFSAAVRQGYDDSLTTTGRYWCTQLPIDSYNLAGKKGLNNSHAAVVNMVKFWQITAGYKYLDYSGSGNHQQILSQLQPGCAMFQESKHGVYTGYEHAAVVKDVSINNGNGYIMTYDSNGPKKTSRYIIDNWQVTNNFYSYVSFGC